MFRPAPVGLPGLAVLALLILLGTVALLAAGRRRAGDEVEASARRSHMSGVGILLQGLAFGVVGYGPVLVALDPLGTAAMGGAFGIALLGGGALLLFSWAAWAMGRNWSLRARTLADHQLVQHGPFSYVRHPIYVALALHLLALTVAMGHARQLLLAVPVYALGTWLRVRGEEALLRRQFGAEHDAFAARVRRFLPGVF